MLKKILFHFFCFSSVNALVDSSLYYKQSFLRKYDFVRQELKAQGFKEINFKTSDDLMLNGLLLVRPNARCNVVVSAGFLPGRMESLAPFFLLLPQDCNILFFDARGHGKSEGPLLSQVWRYGVSEYKDLIGGIAVLHRLNRLPIFLTGICSGAFNAARACIMLEKKDLLKKYNVKGLVFDSGWGSVAKIASTIVVSGCQKRLLHMLAVHYKTKDQNVLKKSLVYKAILRLVKNMYSLVYASIVKPLVMHYENQTNIFDGMKTISCPVLFIHSYDDTYAAMSEVKNLSSLVQNMHCWWIEKNTYHACHHLKHKKMYKKKITQFIDASL